MSEFYELLQQHSVPLAYDTVQLLNDNLPPLPNGDEPDQIFTRLLNDCSHDVPSATLVSSGDAQRCPKLADLPELFVFDGFEQAAEELADDGTNGTDANVSGDAESDRGADGADASGLARHNSRSASTCTPDYKRLNCQGIVRKVRPSSVGKKKLLYTYTDSKTGCVYNSMKLALAALHRAKDRARPAKRQRFRVS